MDLIKPSTAGEFHDSWTHQVTLTLIITQLFILLFLYRIYTYWNIFLKEALWLSSLDRNHFNSQDHYNSISLLAYSVLHLNWWFFAYQIVIWYRYSRMTMNQWVNPAPSTTQPNTNHTLQPVHELQRITQIPHKWDILAIRALQISSSLHLKDNSHMEPHSFTLVHWSSIISVHKCVYKWPMYI